MFRLINQLTTCINNNPCTYRVQFSDVANNVDPERTPQLAASDQELHSFLAEMTNCSFLSPDVVEGGLYHTNNLRPSMRPSIPNLVSGTPFTPFVGFL